MVTQLQFAAIAAFLMWCLVSSLCGVLGPDRDDGLLIWREHGATGWTPWREAHFGLTGSDRRLLSEPKPVVDGAARTSLLDTVLQQAQHPDSDAVQFAVIRRSANKPTTPVFVSGAETLTEICRNNETTAAGWRGGAT